MVLAVILITLSAGPNVATLDCSAGTDVRADTAAYTAVDGTTYALAVKSDDDHSSNSHQCQSEYVVVVKAAGKEAQEVEVGTAAIGEYDRRLMVVASGFTEDGTRLLGMTCEEGPHGAEVGLVDFSLAAGVDAARGIEMLPVKNCAVPISVAGTLASGEAVVEVGARRWVMAADKGKRRGLKAGDVVRALKVGTEFEVERP